MKKLPLRLLILVALALPTAAVAQRGDPVYVEDRLNQLQQAISLLTGQIEQLQYRNQQLQQQMEKMQADYENLQQSIEELRQEWQFKNIFEVDQIPDRHNQTSSAG